LSSGKEGSPLASGMALTRHALIGAAFGDGVLDEAKLEIEDPLDREEVGEEESLLKEGERRCGGIYFWGAILNDENDLW